MKSINNLFLLLLIFLFSISPSPGFAANGPEYQLYKNYENYGILTFPKKTSFDELDIYLKSIGFKPVESGKAVMRYGSKGENSTFMMPPDVQKKFAMKKFIIVQVLPDHRLMVAIFDPEWGLTLPQKKFSLEEAKKNIPKTLDVFRGPNQKREILWQPGRTL